MAGLAGRGPCRPPLEEDWWLPAVVLLPFPVARACQEDRHGVFPAASEAPHRCRVVVVPHRCRVLRLGDGLPVRSRVVG